MNKDFELNEIDDDKNYEQEYEIKSNLSIIKNSIEKLVMKLKQVQDDVHYIKHNKAQSSYSSTHSTKIKVNLNQSQEQCCQSVKGLKFLKLEELSFNNENSPNKSFEYQNSNNASPMQCESNKKDESKEISHHEENQTDISYDKSENMESDPLNKLVSIQKSKSGNQPVSFALNVKKESGAMNRTTDSKITLDSLAANSSNFNNSFKLNMITKLGPKKINLQEMMKLRIENRILDKLRNTIKFEADEQPGICVLTDSDMNVFHANTEFTNVLQYTLEVVINSKIGTLLEAECRTEFEERVHNMRDLRTTEIKELEVFIQDANNKCLKMAIDSKFIKNSYFPDKPYFAFYFYFKEASLWQVVDPSSSTQLAWSLLILFLISFLLFWIPQELAFGQVGQYNLLIDNVSLVVFSFDILLNFFVSQEEDGVKVVNLLKMVEFQVKGWFLLDLLATIPFDWVMQVDINISFLKGFKMIKLLRLMRMLRMDQFSLFNIDELSKNENGKELIQMWRRNRGFLSLLKNNVQILLAAHYFSILQFYLKTNIISPELQITDWLMSEHNYGQTDFDNSDVQFFLMQENIKTALGLGVIDQYTKSEITVQILQMFLALSLQGQGIGNISSYLNYANQVDIEQHDAITYFTDLCTLHNIDSRTQGILMYDIEKHFEKQGDKEFQLKGTILSKNVYLQLESNLQRKFIRSFKLLERLDISTVRVLKSSCNIMSDSIVVRKESIISSIYFVMDGSIKVQDEKMNLVNKQVKDEVFGINCFYELVARKFSLDLEEMYQKYTDNRRNKLNATANLFTFQRKPSNTELDHENDLLNDDDLHVDHHNLLMLLEDQQAKIKFPHNAFATENSKQLVVPQEVLEEIMLQDIGSFMALQSQSRNEAEVITQNDYEIQNQNKEYINNCKIQTITVLTNGRVWDYNQKFADFVDDKQEIRGNSLYDLVDFGLDGMRIFDIGDAIRTGSYRFKSIKGSIQVRNFFKLKIIREDEYNKITQYKLKKSMLNAYIIEFDINPNIN